MLNLCGASLRMIGNLGVDGFDTLFLPARWRDAWLCFQLAIEGPSMRCVDVTRSL